MYYCCQFVKYVITNTETFKHMQNKLNFNFKKKYKVRKDVNE